MDSPSDRSTRSAADGLFLVPGVTLEDIKQFRAKVFVEVARLHAGAASARDEAARLLTASRAQSRELRLAGLWGGGQ